jgi:predicted PurR-regulated permease PerM
MEPRATGAETAAFVMIAAGLLFVFQFHLGISLIAGLLAYTLLAVAFRLIRGPRLSHGAAKVVAAAALGLLAATALTGVVLLIVGFARGRVGALPTLFEEVGRILGQVHDRLQSWGVSFPFLEDLLDAQRLQETASEWFRDHAAQLTHAGGEAGRFLVHALVGAALGFLVFFQHPRPDPDRPFAVALAERIRRLAASFEMVVLAQIEISAINTLLTGIFLFVVLPLFGRPLPFSGTLLAVTFGTGLLPVVGNLISNTLIVAVSAGVSLWVALGSLIFLVVVHKLEYFLNARIIGGQISARAWELLIAMLFMEAVFGAPGLIAGPIYYAYLKRELKDAQLI